MTEVASTSAPRIDAALEAFVCRQVARLWQGYQADRADTVAELARLRRGTPRAGEIPQESWGIFQRGFPEGLVGHGDLPSRAELAAASALALFAQHQQSRRTLSMHQSGQSHGVGAAAFELRLRADSGGVERRVQALIRANGFDPVLEHLRALIGQLRAHEIPLDYGRLALELVAVQRPGGSRGVRVRWSRDFYRPVAGLSGDSEQIAGEMT